MISESWHRGRDAWWSIPYNRCRPSVPRPDPGNRSQYGIDELLAVRSLVGRHVCKVRTREIHLGIIGVPVESGLSASFGVTFKGRGHRTICQIFIDVDVARRSGKCHADVPVMVEYGLISVAPFGSRPSGPCSPVGWNPVTVLVIVPFSFFLRTPIDFGDNDGVRIYYRHRLSELLDERFPIGILVAVIIPSHVGMHSVAYIIAFDGIALITSVIALPSVPGTQMIPSKPLARILSTMGWKKSYGARALSNCRHRKCSPVRWPIQWTPARYVS